MPEWKSPGLPQALAYLGWPISSRPRAGWKTGVTFGVGLPLARPNRA
jgi:hypothetical protein